MPLSLFQSRSGTGSLWHIADDRMTCGRGEAIRLRRNYRAMEVTGGDFPWGIVHRPGSVLDPWDVCSDCLINLRARME
jgi:hypothetical protein